MKHETFLVARNIRKHWTTQEEMRLEVMLLFTLKPWNSDNRSSAAATKSVFGGSRRMNVMQ